VLGKETVKKIPQARLVEFKGMGHAPQMEDPLVFHRTLLEELQRN
jgi:pimeloyl-ACP methyl ester carboxylesterase